MKPALYICTDHFFFKVDKSKEDPNGKRLTWFVLHEAPKTMAIPPPPPPTPDGYPFTALGRGGATFLI